jgi:acetyl esterase/lipase
MTTPGQIVLGEHPGDDASIVFGDVPTDPPDGRRYLRNVTVATLTPYLPPPDAATGTGVIVAPGGGLHFLSIDNEGVWVAERLVEQGIAAFVLRYRLEATPGPPAEFAAVAARIFSDRGYMAEVSAVRRQPAVEDGGAAIRYVRERAAMWQLDPDRIGMLGFSAGGFVTLVTTVDAPSSARPSFAAPIYPAMWGEVVVPVPAPPMFLAWASDDELGEPIVGAGLRVYDAWHRAGAAVEAHAYATGGHGFGMTRKGTTADRWFDQFLTWLKASGF